jgi:hypothetical protein
MCRFDFHTFHTCCNRYGTLKPALDGLLPYLPHLPYLSPHGRMQARAHARVYARAGNHQFSMEGMEVWKKQADRGLQGSIPFPHLVEVWK